MSNFTDVYFKCFSDHAFKVASVLGEFNLFGRHITIHSYGAIIAFGFLLAVLLGGRIAYTWKMSLDKMIDVLIYGTIAGIIGARLYFVFSKWDYYGSHPSEIFKIWEGGLAIYGGLICGIIAAYVVSKIRKMNFYNLLDCAGIAFLVGQGIGRWGNYANQEAFGINTSLPWGMKSAKTTEYLVQNYISLNEQGMSVDPFGYVHPTFLYESLWCLIGVIVLYVICRKFRKFSGQMFLWYGVWYGLERSVVEGLRTDSLYIVGTSLRVSQVISIAFACVCLALLIMKTYKYKKHPQPIDGIDFFLEEKLNPETKEVSKKEESIVEETTQNENNENVESVDSDDNANEIAENEQAEVENIIETSTEE